MKIIDKLCWRIYNKRVMKAEKFSDIVEDSLELRRLVDNYIAEHGKSEELTKIQELSRKMNRYAVEVGSKIVNGKFRS